MAVNLKDITDSIPDLSDHDISEVAETVRQQQKQRRQATFNIEDIRPGMSRETRAQALQAITDARE